MVVRDLKVPSALRTMPTSARFTPGPSRGEALVRNGVHAARHFPPHSRHERDHSGIQGYLDRVDIAILFRRERAIPTGSVSTSSVATPGDSAPVRAETKSQYPCHGGSGFTVSMRFSPWERTV